MRVRTTFATHDPQAKPGKVLTSGAVVSRVVPKDSQGPACISRPGPGANGWLPIRTYGANF